MISLSSVVCAVYSKILVSLNEIMSVESII